MEVCLKPKMKLDWAEFAPVLPYTLAVVEDVTKPCSNKNMQVVVIT